MKLRSQFSQILFSILLLIFLPQSIFASQLKGLFVLVPGTLSPLMLGDIRLNPIAHELEANPSFSIEIVKTIEDAGYGVYVAKGLDSFGKLEANGERVYRQLVKWYTKNYPKGDMPITLLGHSAGGLYSLSAASINKELPIKRIVLFSTPMQGSQLADALLRSSSIAYFLRRVISEISQNFIDLRGLDEMTAEGAEKFLASIRVSDKIKIYSVGASAPIPKSFKQAYESSYLSPVFTMSSKYFDCESDGLVDPDSAFAQNSELMDQDQHRMSIRPLKEVKIVLDHTKQTQDYRMFQLLGFQNANYIRQTQRDVFQKIIQVIDSE